MSRINIMVLVYRRRAPGNAERELKKGGVGQQCFLIDFECQPKMSEIEEYPAPVSHQSTVILAAIDRIIAGVDK